MAQHRFFNYRENDSTDLINRHLLGILPSGLYAGFDPAVFPNSLNLTLNHETTGLTEVTVDGIRTVRLGTLRTQQGVVIKEDAPITVGITTNSAGNPRIDTVIIEHVYEDEVVGGSQAIYKVITGVKSANPVPAALPFPERQMAIGYLYVPGGMTALNMAGVIYTRINTPTLGNDPKILRQNVDQYNISRKQLLSVYGKSNTASVSLDNNTLNLTTEGNYFTLPKTTDGYLNIDNVSAVYSADTYIVDILCLQRLKLRSRSENGVKMGNLYVHQTGFNYNNLRDGDVYIEEGETIRLVDRRVVVGSANASFFILKGGEVTRAGSNKLNGEIIFNRGTADLAGGQVSLDGLGNYYRLQLVGDNDISWLPLRAPRREGYDRQGSVVFLSIMVSPDPDAPDTIPKVTLTHATGNAPEGTKLISTPSKNDFSLFNGDVLMLIEEEDTWILASIIGTNSDIRTLTEAYNIYVNSNNTAVANLTAAFNSHLDAYNYQVNFLNSRINNIILGALAEARELTFNSLLEDAVILRGIEVISYTGAVGNTGTIELSGGVAALNGDILEVPPYAGNFPIFLQRQGPGVGVWRTAPASPEYDGVNFIRFAPFTSQRLADVVKRASYGLRDLRMSLSYDPINFDVTGRGIFSEYGFALANGVNDTDNMTGMTPIGFNPAALRESANPNDPSEPFNPNQGLEYRELNDVLGSKRHILSVPEMPGHTHPINLSGAHSHKIPLSDDNSGNGPVPQKGNVEVREGDTKTDGAHTHTMQSVGGNQAHENRQPSRVTMFLQRIPVIKQGWMPGTGVTPGDGGGGNV